MGYKLEDMVFINYSSIKHKKIYFKNKYKLEDGSTYIVTILVSPCMKCTAL